MRVVVRQIYTRVGISFPFSHLLQVYLTSVLSTLAAASASKFEAKFGAGFELVINVTAVAGTIHTSIKGPTVYKRDHDVEFTLELPFDVVATASDRCAKAVVLLLEGVEAVFSRVALDVGPLQRERAEIAGKVCSDSSMTKGPWLP